MVKLSYGVLIIVLVSCDYQEGTSDRIRGDFYLGTIEERKLADSVQEVEPSTLTVDFSLCDGNEQCAEIDFNGELTVIGISVKGNPPQTVRGVIIDGNALYCETNADGYILIIEGTFANDRATLDASVSTPVFGQAVFLGSVHLAREEPDDEASDTDGDTGTDAS
jgi:hypothetical protein